MNSHVEHVETVIVGGGQAGLSVGYHLARRGRPFLILDASERIGDSWRKRWDSLRLFTPTHLDGLPGMPFPAPAQYFPTKDDMADYLAAYAEQLHLPVRTGVRVDRLSRLDDRFVVSSGDRRFEANNVVVAVGAYQSPRIPAFAAELHPGIVQMHSTEYREPAQLREGDVLVVGAGNSGAEIAFEVSRTHRTWLSGRDTGHEPVRLGSGPDRLLTPLLRFLAMHILTVRTPMGQKLKRMFRSRGIPLGRVWRKDLAAAGVELGPRTAGVRDGLPVLEDGTVLDVVNVIWCTGFVSDLSWIELPVFDENGDPVQDRGVVALEPGLYFIGLVFLYALASPLIFGVGRDADHVAEHIARRVTANGLTRSRSLDRAETLTASTG